MAQPRDKKRSDTARISDVTGNFQLKPGLHGWDHGWRRMAVLHAYLHALHCAYLFDGADKKDWIARHFFTGDVMPSHHLIRQGAGIFAAENEWRWFFPATAGLFGYANGREWGVRHQRMTAVN